MSNKKLTTQPGFTLIELMVATVLATIVIFGISVMLNDSQRGWHRMYNRIYSDVVTDSYIARKTFDAVIRKSDREKYLLDNAGNWLEVYYYADANSTTADRYARFYYDPAGDPNNLLNVEYGIVEPRETLDTQTICGNVSSCTFTGAGRSAQMILTLNDGSQTATVVTSSVMHN
jgi:prepilin-type N-terminal cleavage/methylation domain-containing protein